MRRVQLIALLVLAPTLVFAQGTFKTYGIEAISCGTYVQQITADAAKRTIYGWWLSAFITGANWVRTRDTTTDTGAHEQWLKKYCEEHPLELLISAATKLDVALETGTRTPNRTVDPDARKSSSRGSP